jgi:hypothetical protein
MQSVLCLQEIIQDIETLFKVSELGNMGGERTGRNRDRTAMWIILGSPKRMHTCWEERFVPFLDQTTRKHEARRKSHHERHTWNSNKTFDFIKTFGERLLFVGYLPNQRNIEVPYLRHSILICDTAPPRIKFHPFSPTYLALPLPLIYPLFLKIDYTWDQVHLSFKIYFSGLSSPKI